MKRSRAYSDVTMLERVRFRIHTDLHLRSLSSSKADRTPAVARWTLADLCREEHFNFDDFRQLALRARDSLGGRPYAADIQVSF